MTDWRKQTRKQLPGAPEDAIKQISDYLKRHEEFMKTEMKDITAMWDILEEFFSIMKRWSPEKIEPEIQRLVEHFGEIICKGDKTCTEEFESNLRSIIALSDIKEGEI